MKTRLALEKGATVPKGEMRLLTYKDMAPIIGRKSANAALKAIRGIPALLSARVYVGGRALFKADEVARWYASLGQDGGEHA